MGLLLRRRVRPAAGVGRQRWRSVRAKGSCGWHRSCGARRPTQPSRSARLVVLSRRPISDRTAAIGGLLAGLGFPDPLRAASACGRDGGGDGRCIGMARRPNAPCCSACRCLRGGGGRHQFIVGHPQSRRGRSATRAAIRGRRERATVSNGPPGVHRDRPHRGRRRLVRIGEENESASPSSSASLCLRLLALQSRQAVVLDLGMAAFALTSFVVPIVARRATANDIELRVMSPMLIPVIYAAVVTFDRLCTRRVVALAGTALLGMVDVPGGGVRGALPRPRARRCRLQAAIRTAVVRRDRCAARRREDPDEQPSAGVVVHTIVNRP